MGPELETFGTGLQSGVLGRGVAATKPGRRTLVAQIG